MTHPTLATMVEAAKKATPGEWVIDDLGPRWSLGISSKSDGGAVVWSSELPDEGIRHPEDAAHILATQPANILSLAEYVRGLEEKAAALLEDVTYLSGKYPLEPSLSGLEVAASDLRVALGGKP